MDTKFDLITIGDSTIDTFIRVHDATVECDINEQDCKICVPYGAKVPVDSIAHSVAGNAANVSLGAGKLGLDVAIYTNVGDDDNGKTIKKRLEDSNIFDGYIVENAGKESNLSVVLTFKGERTIFVYHQDWDYHLPKLDRTKWVYLTSMAETFSETDIMNDVTSYVFSTGAKLAYGPGTHQLGAGLKKFPKVLENCQLLIVNLEEAKRICGIDQADSADPKDILSRLLLMGPKSAVITDSSNGSYGNDGSRSFRLGVFPTTVVEKTGAGDAYSAGMVSGLCYDLPFSEAMVWGAINSACVVGKLGSSKGLMTKDEIEKYRKTVPELKAVTF